ncbi:hypothetical protein [Flavobacterium tegetincola]|uniref:hypothetical protein n=1 Tax=Flavobacterium tegetincola TaxID=150172 RepID=UPI00041E0E43|nr:hypothetical protein [Flavobacterium tegetincola]
MSFLNQINHPEKLIETKVNFFADYFNFVASQIEKSDYLDVENYLSLIEKMIFQIETNIENCSKYIDSYLSHPLIQKENKYFKDFKNYSLISNLFEEYKNQGKVHLKIKWINQNQNFKSSLIRFRTELKKVMFKKSLKEIISFLKCVHNISEHKLDLIHHTNILVSEFLLTNRAKDDIIETFTKIITQDINSFPFPQSFLKENKNNLLEAKNEYIQNRTFDQQFEGILHLLKKSSKREYFVFRIYNIKAEKTFRFKYNQVTFYHPEHTKLKILKNQINESPFSKDFFLKQDMILASVKINASSKRIAEQIAINTIKRELEFIDYKCGANSLFENHSYIVTTDFKDLSSKWSRQENSHTISEWNKKSLENNPFLLLKNVNSECKEHFLNYEYLYIKAQISRNPEDYWHYFETLLKANSNNTVNVINIITTILILSSHQNEKTLIENYIFNSIINSFANQLNLSQEQYFKIRNSQKLDFQFVNKEISHPFIKYLLKKRNINPNQKYLKSYYSRILWDCYSQRNSVMHNYQRNEKGLILIDSKLPNLTLRFRETLINSMLKHKESNFTKLIEKLNE